MYEYLSQMPQSAFLDQLLVIICFFALSVLSSFTCENALFLMDISTHITFRH